MEFDLKTACEFIPVMNSNGTNIKNIIDSVEMYSDMLSDAGKQILIKFVLKSRLSENAKLRMSKTYSTSGELTKAMRDLLLPKQSYTAIQTQLQNTTQGWRTVDQFGTEIEKLFTKLTIAQADGDSSKYSVLKPINEKMSIKQFADGLHDPRLSTIIVSRNYDSLQQAIQAAKDEEKSKPSTSGTGDEVMYFSRRGRGNVPFISYQGQYNNDMRSNQRGFNQGAQRGNYRGRRSNNFGNNFYRGNSSNRPAHFSNYRGYQSNYFRGRAQGSYQNTNGRDYQNTSNKTRSSYGTNGRGNHRIFCSEQSDQNNSINVDSNEMQFFRS